MQWFSDEIPVQKIKVNTKLICSLPCFETEAPGKNGIS